MRAVQARTIAIDEYLLQCESIRPASVRRGGRELWFHSPLRAWDSTPSFKVDTSLNVWYDHGLARGGNVLDLVCVLRNLSVREALAVLRHSGLYRGGTSSRAPKQRAGRAATSSFWGGQSLSKSPWTPPARHTTSKPQNSPTVERPGAILAAPASEKEKISNQAANTDTSLRLISVWPIKHRALVQYLEARCIPMDIAKAHLKEVEFSPPGRLQKYVALGWKNGNGYEVRNKHFKGFVGTWKTISILNPQAGADLLVFEGFIDFLSYLTLVYQRSGLTMPQASTVAILNSTSLRARLVSAIEQYQPSRVFMFLDRDTAGQDCLDYFQLALPNVQIIDKSGIYAGYKDFNAMLCDQTTAKTIKNAST